MFRYTWKRNGIDFNPSGNDDRVVQLPNSGTIVITKPEDKDEGIFQCFAENSYGKSATININLREAKLKVCGHWKPAGVTEQSVIGAV